MTVKITRPSIDIRGTLDELNKPSGIAGEAMLRADSVQEQRNLIGAGRKNLIINGGFDVWQRGTSFTTSYFADRFSGNHSGHTTTKSTDVPTGKGFENSAQFVGSGSDPYFFQIVEGSATIAGKEATFSFWIKGGLGQCYIFDGGYTAVESTLIETIGAWTRRSITHAFATGSYNPLLRIGLPINTSNTCHTTGWQLELGSFATPFEHRSYGEELALCQRYYERINGTSPWFFGHGYNSQVYMTVEWKVPKRVSGGTVYYSDQGAPASMFTLYGNTGSSGAIDGVITSVSLSNAAVTALSFYLSLSSSANTPYGTSVMWRLDSARWIAYDAEI